MIQPEILSATADYTVINKPAGFSVELSDRFPSVIGYLKEQNQPAFVVHRLDVETSGLVIVAKGASSAEELRQLWQGRVVKKTYLAVVAGETPEKGEIELAIERDNRKDRQRAVILFSDKSRVAITLYKRLVVGSSTTSRLKEWGSEKVSLVECHPVTGRTHQIRVHLQSLKHPILGDKLYSNKASEQLTKDLTINRQLLHAWKLELPGTAEFIAPLPEDFRTVLDQFISR